MYNYMCNIYLLCVCFRREDNLKDPFSAFLIEVHSAIYHNVIGWAEVIFNLI